MFVLLSPGKRGVLSSPASQPAEGRPEGGRLSPAPWVVAIALSLALFLPPAIGSGWILDDTTLFSQVSVDLPSVVSWWTTSASFVWRPLAWTVQRLVASPFGNAPEAYRLLDLAVHLANVGLIGACAVAAGGRSRTAALLAAAWCVHPATIDTVSWNAAGTDVFSVSFCLTALLGVLRGWHPAAVGSAVLAALLCKETAIPVVAVLPIVAASRGQRPWGPAVAGAVAVTAWWVAHGVVTHDSPQAALRSWEGALAWIQGVPWPLYCPPSAPLFHVFDPADRAATGIGLAGLGGLLTLALLSRDRNIRLAVAAWLLMLAPVGPGVAFIGVQPVRYAYLPLAVSLALLAGSRRLDGRVFMGAVVAWCLIAAPRAFLRAQVWNEERSIFADELFVERENPVARWYAGSNLVRVPEAPSERETGFRLMLGVLDAERPRRVDLLDRPERRQQLAEMAFVYGAPGLALEQAQKFIAETRRRGVKVPANAWCLVADASDALGVVVPPEAESGCASGTTGAPASAPR